MFLLAQVTNESDSLEADELRASGDLEERSLRPAGGLNDDLLRRCKAISANISRHFFTKFFLMTWRILWC